LLVGISACKDEAVTPTESLPRIDSLSSYSARVGDIIKIYGKGFNNSPSWPIVYFDTQFADPSCYLYNGFSSVDTIKMKVLYQTPRKTKIKVLVNADGKEHWSNEVDFEVLPPW
jgi:hypothetical protein